MNPATQKARPQGGKEETHPGHLEGGHLGEGPAGRPWVLGGREADRQI